MKMSAKQQILMVLVLVSYTAKPGQSQDLVDLRTVPYELVGLDESVETTNASSAGTDPVTSPTEAVKSVSTPNVLGISNDKVHGASEKTPLEKTTKKHNGGKPNKNDLREGTPQIPASTEDSKTKEKRETGTRKNHVNNTNSEESHATNSNEQKDNREYDKGKSRTLTTNKPSTSSRTRAQGRQSEDCQCQGTKLQGAESNLVSKVGAVNVSIIPSITEKNNPSTTAKTGSSNSTVKITLQNSNSTTTSTKAKTINWKNVLNVVGKVIGVFTLVGGAFYFVYSVM